MHTKRPGFSYSTEADVFDVGRNCYDEFLKYPALLVVCRNPVCSRLGNGALWYYLNLAQPMPKLQLTRTQAAVLAHALNSCRLSTFNTKQQEHLPELGRKLAEFLADNGPEEPKRKPGRPKRANPFDTPERAKMSKQLAALRRN